MLQSMGLQRVGHDRATELKLQKGATEMFRSQNTVNDCTTI